MDFEQIVYEKADNIATITLNRPERMNAFTPKMIDEWYAALLDAHTDPETRVVIVTGAGRGFCAGADVSGRGPIGNLMDRDRSMVENRNFLRDGVQRIPRLVSIMEKPYIAAVNGPAAGAGMDMASMCDIRFAADTANGDDVRRMGIIPGDGGAYYLPRIVGMAKALDLIWSGRMIDAQEALAMGYVSAVVPADDLISHTRAYGEKLVKGPAVAIQQAKRLAYRSQDVTLDAALDLAGQAMFVAQSTEDAREGPRSFAEKREPEFKGGRSLSRAPTRIVIPDTRRYTR
jgi:2-(1,2-epoxy-1,2-dihydrophenyl)acetyl-CoA isomerase